ncbi:DAK2 domain-containing protein [Ammoniphilus sp. CFH 90114]|uniref:DAK2 domain-containing protein n=1 Tax=Ammoniphilus sp. CFH 90114 TaxID=2493665 RepID=UPI00100FE361|nr:DAK2 domain-containing protein [Ammoniphilus sp. CFH 90114]RXT15056.1 DAK2 domain-containing protein [Ammoniphilus sp. CFH 90114]
MNHLTAQDLTHMYLTGAASLSRHAGRVDALNVFPVPDGDTGTNMNLTMTSGVAELKKHATNHAGKAAQSLSKGLLMGARGNSGVILSQLFRGFAKAITDQEKVNADFLAQAFSKGVTMAYDAVMKPVEGTILTVAKDAAAGAVRAAKRSNDCLEVLKATLDAAEESLARTPDLLPVLKEVGVVDSGGQGLVYIYQGFYQALQGEMVLEEEESPLSTFTAQMDSQPAREFAEEKAQIHLKTEDIHFGYCTEFLVKLDGRNSFHQGTFRESISRYGDSLLVVSDDDLVKVHIHSEQPGDVLSFGQRYGELTGIKIENMREQHSHILQGEDNEAEATPDRFPVALPRQPYGVVAVAIGEGISDILKSLGVDEVVLGGQSMNPSTEDLVNAATRIQADHIFFLPNNKNVIMAAEQASQLLDIPSSVIPSRSIPQGMAAMLAFRMDGSVENNREEMIEALSQVKTGQVTYAVRDTKIEQLEIKEGDHLGLSNGEIVATGSSAINAAQQLLSYMIEDSDEIVTIFYGEEINQEQVNELLGYLQESYPDLEIETHAGGQPLYSFIFSIE